jgi:hypothetical protein
MSYTNPCPSWDGCSAARCPATEEGVHYPEDQLCPKLPLKFVNELGNDLRGFTQEGIHRMIQKAFMGTALGKRLSGGK